MRKVAFGVILAAVLIVGSPVALAAADPEIGEVVWADFSCDYFVVASPFGDYSVLQAYSFPPDEGDLIYGEYEKFGTHTFYNLTSGLEFNAWVDNYWLTPQRAARLIVDRCDAAVRQLAAG